MSQRTTRTERKAKDYSGLSDINHVFKRPDTYIGSVKKHQRRVKVIDETEMKIKEITTDLPQGVERLVLEILSNAGDNTDSSRRAGVNPGSIDITANEKTINITNGGLHIPVKKVRLVKENENTFVRDYVEGEPWEWLPVFIFGYLRTSNNYDENVKRMGAGKNGFGAKLTCIFSKRFQIKIQDPDNKQELTATWYDNMFLNNRNLKPTVEVKEVKTIKKGSVSVEWDLDFDRFGMKEYSKKDLSIFRRFAVDFSFTCKVKTSFNGIEFDYREITNYASLLWSEEQMTNRIIEYIWEPNADKELKDATVKTQEKRISNATKPENIPEVEIMVVDTPDKAVNMSYVNGLITAEGGVHVDAAEEPVFEKIKDILLRLLKKNKLRIDHIRPHVSFIVNARLCDPDYSSQSKTKLTSPNVEIKYKEKSLRKVSEWGVIKRLMAEAKAMAYLKASKGDGTKRKHIDCQNGEDANYAGTDKSLKCTLHLVEGLSAANYPQKRICMLEGGKDFYGYLPMKGKVLNVTNADMDQYAENTVIVNIKKMLGLKEEVDYSLDENLKDLRYGKILMCVDADDDGMHIAACVLNFFREKFPGIIKRNMIGYLRTPVIKVFNKTRIHKRFFTVDDFEKWKEKNSTKGLSVRYYKGLGTSNDKDIEDDLATSPTVVCFYDSKCEENFNLAFHQDMSDQRKKWIAEWRDVAQVDDVVSMDISKLSKLEKAQDITQFLNRELVRYSVASLFRAIPSQYDMLKESQRKALWSALDYFKYDPSKGGVIKTGRFANKAADVSQYHHGEKSLTDTIIKMAQDFIGSNNMGYFKKEGQFGTRADGGKNAADARYSQIHLSWWIPYVFKKEYIEMVEKNITDDEVCEPKWLPGVIPVGLVNGTTGIATGFSTASPCYNPLHVIKWYKDRCKGVTDPKPLKPWFNGFDGKITIERKKDDEDFVIEDDDDEEIEREEAIAQDLSEDDVAIMDHTKGCKYRMKTYGNFKTLGTHRHGGPIIEIDEIPVKKWIHDYRKHLQTLVQQKGPRRAIFDFKDNSTTEKPKFLIHWNSKYAPVNHSTLNLVKSFGLSNITLIDHEGFPTQFTDIQDVLQGYYKHMIEHYEVVRQNRIRFEEEKLQDTEFKIKFISLVLKEEIKIFRVKEEYIEGKMKDHKIPMKYYENSKSRDFSVESLEKHKKSLEECKARLSNVNKTKSVDMWIADLDELEKQLKKKFKSGKLIN